MGGGGGGGGWGATPKQGGGKGLRPSQQSLTLVPYLSRLSLKVHVLPGGNLPLVAVLVGWEELQREVGSRSNKGLGTKDQKTG